ncbi:UNVERIFIED_CONTAM: hypothetical protein PYX00_001205 [Menopon gallinae]|uniref:Phosphatidic acid phosphatase type 2/haloperoxidase domain-containing protein n=1 Tax=Menopon gallinae TaxID=328185 RepID=A0AAW2IBV8_9NEOP
MANQRPKREVHPALRKLLQLDEQLTEKFCLTVNRFLPLRALKIHYKMLEVSCHGLLWLIGWLAFIWLLNSPRHYQMQTNFFVGLILDIVIVAVIKAFVRRRRPSGNVPDMFATYGPDLYGFPSGHASRSAFIVHFFTQLYPLPVFCYPPMLAWATSICISRILLQRHHILDVIAGVILGILEGLFMGVIWFSQSTCDDLLSWLSDERVEGAEYHV